MRGLVRVIGALSALAGVLVLAWALAVWQWQDPITLLLNKRAQSELANEYETRVAEVRAPALAQTAEPAPKAKPAPNWRKLAARYRKDTETGDPVGRLIVPRLGVDAIVAMGTDSATLKTGPGLHPTTGFPGQGRLTYVAGHRTTYGAPFSDIDDLKPGDRITFELPYGTFRYRVTGHRIVRADALEVLESRGREEIALQACWPRFFASHRYLTYAKLERAIPS